MKAAKPKLPTPSEAETRWEIFIPDYRPASLNELMRNRWVAAQMKNVDRQVVAFTATQLGIPRATTPEAKKLLPARRVSLTLTLPKGQRRFDRDAFWKTTLDALVYAGLLRDDSPKWCHLGPVEQVRGERLGTTIIVEDVTDG